MTRESLEKMSASKHSAGAPAAASGKGTKTTAAPNKPSSVKVGIAIGLFAVATIFVAYRFGLFGGGEEVIPPDAADSSTLTPEQREEYKKIQQEQLQNQHIEGGEAPIPPAGS